MDWFRSWHGAPTDPKWLLIAQRANTTPGIVSAVVWALFDHASQQEERGDVSSFDQETYCAYSGFDPATVAAILSALRDKKVIQDNHLTAWEKRQPKREDNSAERVSRFRKRNVTQCNAEKRPREETEEIQIQNTEAIASDAGASACDQLWGEGVEILIRQARTSETQAKKAVGQMLRDTGGDHAGVLNAIRLARDAKTGDPIAYAFGCLKKKEKPGNVLASTDKLIEIFGAGESEVRGGEGAAVVRMLPKGRRE